MQPSYPTVLKSPLEPPASIPETVEGVTVKSTYLMVPSLSFPITKGGNSTSSRLTPTEIPSRVGTPTMEWPFGVAVELDTV